MVEWSTEILASRWMRCLSDSSHVIVFPSHQLLMSLEVPSTDIAIPITHQRKYIMSTERHITRRRMLKVATAGASGAIAANSPAATSVTARTFSPTRCTRTRGSKDRF